MTTFTVTIEPALDEKEIRQKLLKIKEVQITSGNFTWLLFSVDDLYKAYEEGCLIYNK